LIFAALVMT